MKALEFLTPIINNQIPIPEGFNSDVERIKGKTVRVILLIDEPAEDEEKNCRMMVREQFLQGYSESDSIYDEE